LSATRAAISRAIDAVGVSSSTTTKRRVRETDSKIVSSSSGESVKTSTTSASMPSFKREARFSSWLYQIALNLCRDRMRRKRVRRFVSLDEVDEAPPETGRAFRPSALELVEAQDLSRAIAEAVESLPEEQREVIVLKEYQGLTFLEIADALELPMSTVKTRLYRGLGQLKERLERQGIRGAAAVPAPLP